MHLHTRLHVMHLDTFLISLVAFVFIYLLAIFTLVRVVVDTERISGTLFTAFFFFLPFFLFFF